MGKECPLNLKTVALIFTLLGPGPWIAGQTFESGDLVDCPTAGLLSQGGYELGVRLEPEGGFIARVGVGLFDRFLVRMSYGGNGIIGYGAPTWSPRPEVEARFRIAEEGYLLPALSVGFSSRGYEGYESEEKRYRIKSKGFYGVLAKSIVHLERLDLHLGGNYSLEGEDKDPDLFLGLEQHLISDLSVLGELSCGFNDDEEAGFGQGNGYLNLGVKGALGGRLILQFSFKNLTGNGVAEYGGVNRIAEIAYVDYF